MDGILAPRVAYELGASLITGIVDKIDDVYIKPVLNGKLHAHIKPEKEKVVLTIQTGVFNYEPEIDVNHEVEAFDVPIEKVPLSLSGMKKLLK